MRLSRSIAAPLALALTGCAGGVDVSPMLADFDRYDADVQTLSAGESTGSTMEAGRTKRAEAGALVDDGKGGDALPLAEKALADARVGLEMERMRVAARRAESCRLEVEQARTRWREAAFVLEQTEEFVGRKAEVAMLAPELPEEEAALPATTLEPTSFPDGSADDVYRRWTSWRRVAREQRVAAADVENAFEDAYARAQAADAEEADVAHATYLAARMVQALECRVRTDAHERECLTATAMTGRYGDARSGALRATLELERGLQEHLRGELDQLRAEAQSRQDALYEALSQMEGKFASIRRDARGTIVSLADILFEFDRATLQRDVEFNLVKIATILNQFSEMGILIEGHTDAVGTDEYNLDLSKRRAKAVYEFLLSQDVAAERMSWEGYGESRPVADNETEEGRQQNRRVDLVIQDAPDDSE